MSKLTLSQRLITGGACLIHNIIKRSYSKTSPLKPSRTIELVWVTSKNLKKVKELNFTGRMKSQEGREQDILQQERNKILENSDFIEAHK